MDELFDKAQEIKEACLSMSSPLIVHHYDADGISSASIAYDALKRAGKKPKTLCLNALNEEALDLIEKQEEVIFVDLGSNNERVSEMRAVVIDHHGGSSKNIGTVLNPNDFGYDGGTFASSSSLAYLVFGINRKAALVGAAGDMQLPFTGLNKWIAESDEFQEIEDLNIYGRETRPLSNLLAFSIFEGDYRYTQRFLARARLNPKKTYVELDEEEKIRLRSGLVREIINSRRLDLLERVFGKSHVLKDDFYGLKDLREIATMLNSCGRYGRPWLGIKFMIEGKKHKKEVDKMLRKHKYEIKKAKKVARERLVVDGPVAILDGRGKIKPNIIGVVCSSIYKEMEKVTLGISKEGNKVKLSLRCPEDVNARELLSNVVERVGGIAGGHKKAGGAEIDEKTLPLFIEEFRKNIKGLCISK